MSTPINYSELAGMMAEGMAKEEISWTEANGVTTTTIYSGKPNVTDPSAVTDDRDDWQLCRQVIVENGNQVAITTMWATGSWTNRATLTYKYL